MSQFKKIQNKIVLVLLVPVLLVLHGFGNKAGTDENAVKAMFIYNFAKYIDWSRIDSKPDFVIAVCGNSDIVKYLDEIAQRKTINRKPIVIKVVDSPGECSECQMLFIPDNSAHVMDFIQYHNGNNPLVIITENKETFKKGAHINLVNVDGKMRFELNESRMRNNNIKFSKELTALAIK